MFFAFLVYSYLIIGLIKNILYIYKFFKEKNNKKECQCSKKKLIE